MTVKRKTSSTSDSIKAKAKVKTKAKAKTKVIAKTKAKTKTKTLATKSSGSRPAVRKQAARKASSKTPFKSTKASAATAPARAPRKTATVLAHKPKPPPTPSVVGVIEYALGEMKAVNVKVLDVRELTDIADILVIASGNSDRHVRAIADRVVEEAKKSGSRPMGVEGERDGEWVLVDLQDVIVHIMLPRVREFYRLESLWDVSAARREIVQSA